MPEQYAWMNESEVTLLNGEVIPQNMEFPIEPPAEIGKVRAVHSTCVVGKALSSTRKRWAIIIGIYLLVVLPAPLLLISSGDWDLLVTSLWMMGLLALPTIPISYYFTRGNDWQAYVGEMGLVRYKLGSDRGNIKKTELFEFINAADLYTHSVSQSVNLIYAGTNYNYEWRDADAKRVFKLSGSYNSKQGTPKRSSPYYLATAAEMMWTAFLADAINIELKEQGAVHFKVNKKDWVRVGSGFMEFHFRDKTAKLAVEQIKDLRIGGGQFAIRSQDAGWFGGKGKYGFEYGKMANARLFLMCLEQLCGYSFAD